MNNDEKEFACGACKDEGCEACKFKGTPFGESSDELSGVIQETNCPGQTGCKVCGEEMCRRAHSCGMFCVCDFCVTRRKEIRRKERYDPDTHTMDKKYKWRDFLLFGKFISRARISNTPLPACENLWESHKR
jgi:hypothetical protein